MQMNTDLFIKEGEITDNDCEHYELTRLYTQLLEAFARNTYMSIYVIDFNKKGFLYVSDNPLFLCGMSAEQVREMGFDFYRTQLPVEDLPILLEIYAAVHQFAGSIPADRKLECSLSCDFRIRHPKSKELLIHHKLTPLHLTKEGKIWLALCVVSISSHNEVGNVEIVCKGTLTRWRYDLQTHKWVECSIVILKEEEKKVLYLSAQGYTMTEIAERMNKSVDTIKGYKRQIFDKLGVTSITEAISRMLHSKIT